MLKLLHIENVAVIEKADIEFKSGLNVLTGETGAGKSIVIDALTAVTGGRASREIIRTGAKFSAVTAVFSDNREVAWLNDNFIESDDSGDIIIMRRISADGKSVCRINGIPVSVSQLRELGSELLDIHGQNDGRKLLDEASHQSYLDAFGGVDDAFDNYRREYEKLTDTTARIEKLSLDEGEKARRIDVLMFQVEEIERAKIKNGEHDELSARRELLINSSKLTESLDIAFESLYGGDRSEGAIALIDEALSQLNNAARFSDGLDAICERLTDARYAAQDISDELRDFRAKLVFMPGELDELESRLDVLRRIIRKYGSEEKAVEFLTQGYAEISEIEDSANKLEKLEKELASCVESAIEAANHLSELRKVASISLQAQVMDELSQLNMPGVDFLVEFSSVQGNHGLGVNGRDNVCFLLSANTGEKPGKINRIASGGELARIMLALKNVISVGQDTGTVVFDEIDSGVSGIAAQRVGEKLSKLAQHRQVLCVTHLPQIAVMADAHFEIEKTISEGRTFTKVKDLDLEGRQMEIARLNGGENITQATLISAAEQLEGARKYKDKLRG